MEFPDEGISLLGGEVNVVGRVGNISIPIISTRVFSSAGYGCRCGTIERVPVIRF